uniref:Reverse transcriptase domain-containing protein n=1 Tax=Tanacetum cinerariifolium TaxID=118510 RepID=A0A6L2N995_TANCI|nr:reverse transcriptase domain-containing protein [Tanacetum cinerariifolium]
MSSSTHPIILNNSDIGDAFPSTNIPTYVPASPNYSPASLGNTLFDASEDPFENQESSDSSLPPTISPPQVPIAPPTILPPSPVLPSLIFNPQEFFVPKELLPPKEQASIRQLVADSVVTILEAQVANMTNVDNTNRNPEPRDVPVARKCSYKEFMSYQPFNFKGAEGAVGLIRWFERSESVFSCSNCTKDYKVKFSTGNVTASKPQTLEEAINISQRLMDQVLKHNHVQETNDHKRKFNDRRNTTTNNYLNDRDNENHYHNRNNYRNNCDNNYNNHNNDHHQQQNKRQESVRAYVVNPTKNSWGSWDVHLLMVEFSYNNSYHSSVRCAPFEELHGRKCRSSIMWTEEEREVSTRFVGPFEIIKKADPTLQVPLDETRVDAKLNFMEEPVEILETEFKKLKRSRIAIVKPVLFDERHFGLIVINILQNAYHGWIDKDVIDHIAKGEEKITVWEELIEKFFCKFYPESYDGEDKMLDEGDNWGIDPLEFISRVNSSFDKHMKMDGRTKKVLFHAWMNGSWNKRQMGDSIDLVNEIEEYWWRIYKSRGVGVSNLQDGYSTHDLT